jgi:prenyltransferase beta subunit
MARLTLLFLGALFFSGSPALAGETGVKDTIIYLQKLQASSGGFLPYQPTVVSVHPTLRSTSAAIRALRYLGGEVPDKAACIKFVESCFDPKTGAFSDTPRGEGDLFTTAVGIMAVVELKMPPDKYATPASRYVTDNAKTFEDIRIAAAAFESLKQASTRNDLWLKDIRKTENADGTFGKGTEQARATGGGVALALRLGGKIAEPDAVITVLKKGQRKTGAYGKGDAGDASDLETTYRVMRSFMMLKSRPDDVAALRAFIAKCRNSDGGYGIAPGQASSASGTYFAVIIQHWLSKA